MTTAKPVDVCVNPADTTQRYILWGNGRVDAVNAPPITSLTSTWFDRIDQQVGVAIWVTNWTTGAGYVLDYQGYVQQMNGAPALGVGANGGDCTALGLPILPRYRYCDWSWDPAGSNHFLVLDGYGQIYNVNGATACPRTGPRWAGYLQVHKLQALWVAGQPTKALTLGTWGDVRTDYGASVTSATEVFWPGWDAARDFVVTDWNTPNKGYVLDLYGGLHSFGGAPAAFGFPYNKAADNARCLAVINASNPLSLWEVWSAGQQFEWNSSTAPTVTAGSGITEVQKVTITGTPTGGTFTLTFGVATTAATAFNASAATVQTNLQALSTIGSGNVTVTGGPGPGTPYTVTFAGSLAVQSVAQMTSSSSFTGGSSPAIAVTTLTDGVTASPANTVATTTRPALTWIYSDAQADSQAAWEVYLFTQAYVSAHAGIDTNPATFATGALAYGTDTSTSVRGVVANIDLSNGGYKYYVRAQDTSGLWSAWSGRSWTQSVTQPPAPTNLTVTTDQVNFRTGLSLNATGGTATTVRFECSDDGGLTWGVVRGADAVSLASTTSVTDYDAPLGVTRLYRAYTYAITPRIASALSGTGSATITKRTFVLTSTTDPTLGGEVNVTEAPAWTRPVVAGVFQGIGAPFPTVVSDGIPKARRFSLVIDCDSLAEWTLIENLVLSNSTLVMRTPFGQVHYFRVVGDWAREQVRRAPATTELTSLRHAHKTTLPCIEVATPVLTDAALTVPPGPAG